MDGMVNLFGLLQKAKRALSIDDGDCSQDDYLNDLINAEVRVALRRTGRTSIDDAIVKNVALKYDDLNAPIDHTIYFQFNDTPMS